MTTLRKLRVKQIYYDRVQVGFLDPNFEPFFNEGKSKFLENQVISDFHAKGAHEESEYFGVLSWKFRQKRKKDGEWIDYHMDKYKGYECYSFFPEWDHPNCWVLGETIHKDFIKIGNLIFNKLGFGDVDKIDTPNIYMNYWIIKSELFDRYCKEVLNPVMAIMEEDEEIKELLMQRTTYKNSEDLSMRNIANEEQCMELFGVPYYTYHPFVLERCMATFIALNNFTVKHI